MFGVPPHYASGRRCFQMRLPPFCLPLLQIVKEKVAEWVPVIVAALQKCGSSPHNGVTSHPILNVDLAKTYVDVDNFSFEIR